MKIQILPDEQYMVESKDFPMIGRKYLLEDAETGTGSQNRAFHALLQEYYKSGMHSYDAVDFPTFKNLIKKNLGAGFESFVYVEMEFYTYKGYGQIDEQGKRPIIKDAKTYQEIPETIRKNEAMKTMIRGRLKSWADYTKKERMKTMDNLISEMKQVGINSDKFEEILEGLESNDK